MEFKEICAALEDQLRRLSDISKKTEDGNELAAMSAQMVAIADLLVGYRFKCPQTFPNRDA